MSAARKRRVAFVLQKDALRWNALTDRDQEVVIMSMRDTLGELSMSARTAEMCEVAIDLVDGIRRKFVGDL
jgi:hypothetical protein